MKKKIDLLFMKGVFKRALNNKSKLSISSKFEEVPGWDSLGHMRIVSAIEKQLKISFEIDEIVLSSLFNKKSASFSLNIIGGFIFITLLYGPSVLSKTPNSFILFTICFAA